MHLELIRSLVLIFCYVLTLVASGAFVDRDSIAAETVLGTLCIGFWSDFFSGQHFLQLCCGSRRVQLSPGFLL